MTSDVPLIFTVDNIKSGFTGSSSNASVSFGYEANLNRPAGGSSTAFGWKALRIATGDYNTAIGVEALTTNTTGAYNTAGGYRALKNNSTANGNTAFGTNALFTNSSGNSNTAVGYNALQINNARENTAVGYNALQSNSSGEVNTSVGSYSLTNNTGGSGNTALGIGALNTNTMGGNNTAVGYWSGVTTGNLNNTTAIGNGAKVSSSNQVILGNSTVSHIGGYAGWFTVSDGRGKKNIRADVPGLDFINSLKPVTYNMDLDAIDNLFQVEKPDIAQTPSQEFAEIQRAAREAKEKIVQTGFVAQDVEKSARSVGYDFSGVHVDELGVYSLGYAEFVAPLVKAVQELSEMNDRLQEQNDRMQEQINELKEEVDFLKISPRSATSSDLIGDIPRAILYQNAPNPFSERTVIRFELPDKTVNAYIYVFSMQGALVKQLPINSNQSSITLNGSELSAGMYLYSLIVNGQEVDTKRMILTR